MRQPIINTYIQLRINISYSSKYFKYLCKNTLHCSLGIYAYIHTYNKCAHILKIVKLEASKYSNIYCIIIQIINKYVHAIQL